METFLYRLLEGCLIVWLVDKILALCGPPPSPSRRTLIIQIVTMALVLIWIFLGSYIEPIAIHSTR